MSTVPLTRVSTRQDWILPSRGKVGMLCLITAESSIFLIFVIAYIYYLGKSLSGPTPREVLTLPVFTTICLLSSSLTIHLSVAGLKKRRIGMFAAWLAATIALGLIFLAGTAREWHHLIYIDGLTLRTNLFGTTFYSLVGLHASHVIIGLSALSLVLALWLLDVVRLKTDERLVKNTERFEVLAMYWHFVDAVWAVVFTVVYIIGR